MALFSVNQRNGKFFTGIRLNKTALIFPNCTFVQESVLSEPELKSLRECFNAAIQVRNQHSPDWWAVFTLKELCHEIYHFWLLPSKVSISEILKQLQIVAIRHDLNFDDHSLVCSPHSVPLKWHDPTACPPPPFQGSLPYFSSDRTSFCHGAILKRPTLLDM